MDVRIVLNTCSSGANRYRFPYVRGILIDIDAHKIDFRAYASAFQNPRYVFSGDKRLLNNKPSVSNLIGKFLSNLSHVTGASFDPHTSPPHFEQKPGRILIAVLSAQFYERFMLHTYSGKNFSDRRIFISLGKNVSVMFGNKFLAIPAK
ncbi:hypothetical protein D3C87_1449410 [compost metagenome]